MRELLQERGFWIVSLLCFLGMAAGFPFHGMEAPLAAGSFLMYCKTALGAQAMLFLLPVAAVLPMGACYVREASSGYLKFYITRIDRTVYIKRKLLQVFAGGFLPFFLAGLWMCAAAFLFIYPLELRGSVDWDEAREVFRMLLRVSLTGGILSTLSGIFAALFRNYYMAYGLPFVCYYMLVILKERYLPEFYAMYPAEWIAVQQDWGTDKSGIWMFYLFLTAALTLSHGLLLQRRLTEI